MNIFNYILVLRFFTSRVKKDQSVRNMLIGHERSGD
jgi:hypothetical protein